MCDRIIMPDGNEIESLTEDNICFCGTSQKDILIWIVEHLPVLEFDDVVSIHRDVFGYFVSINNNNQKPLHGSAISNANVLDNVIKGKADELSGTDIDGLSEGNETLTFGSSHEHPKPKNNSTRGNMTLHNERELANKPHCSRYDNISNAKQHSRHDRADHTDRTSTKEGTNEEMRGMTAPALQLYKEK